MHIKIQTLLEEGDGYGKTTARRTPRSSSLHLKSMTRSKHKWAPAQTKKILENKKKPIKNKMKLKFVKLGLQDKQTGTGESSHEL